MEFQKEELNEILNIFQQESAEIISSMDEKLLKLEKEPLNKELSMQLFRDAHSLKGSARMLGFDDIQNIAHKIEDIISLIKEEKISITTKLTDTISECLEFILMLINKTVSQKEEFKSPNSAQYIEKLINITKEEAIEKTYINQDELTGVKKEIVSRLDKLEEIVIQALFLTTESRIKNDYDIVLKVENEINNFFSMIQNLDNEEINSIKNSIQNLLNSIEKFKNSDNKALLFLEVNNSLTYFIENFSNYLDKEKILRKDYYEIVEEKLIKISSNTEGQTEIIQKEKLDDIIQKLPLMELGCEFHADALELINALSQQETNNNAKTILKELKEIIEIFKQKNIPITHDIITGAKEALVAVKKADEKEISEAIKKISVINKMAKFNYTDTKKSQKPQNRDELTQSEILNTITNTEIKTLRIDSIKLDNLVGQIGELIVSKIKTNEQLSLAKKINNDLIDWQKNFTKMSYYIKYFDKKYLSDPLGNAEILDYRKIFAYNKQLCSLCEAHNEKITSLIKEMSSLFKQLQESETKLNSTTTEIETMVKNMRILPLSTIFQLFPRMVHNIARDKNKKIDLVIKGSDVTADKSIIEEIKTPLMHIIRNSIDHGIEDIETRKASNKNPVGKIEINASYKDNTIIIDVKDDGRGLDIEKIKTKALEKKLLTQEEINAISDDELTNLIFYPGFSTEDFVTELSGRGLGLDIVNNKISQMQGRVDIFSQVNIGTVVRITLPATVATKKVFIIEEQNQLWALETSVIKTIVRVNSDEIFEKDERNYFIYDGSAIAVYTLSQILNFENTPRETNKYTLMIIETESAAFGIIVEKLISDQEIVHKKLAAPLYKVKHISGITTLANGEACLILNITDIIATVNSKKIGSKIITKNGIVRTRDNYKYKILIVDDSHTTRILQKNILSNYGYNTATATSPYNALEKLRESKFDLIITDLKMPEMDGFEFIENLRKIPVYENIPVIVVSSEQKDKYSDEIERSKIINYIQKNLFKQEELIECIEKTLNY